MIAVKSDEKLQQEVMQELRWDSRLHAATVGVTVNEGVVTLVGSVGSYGEKVAAQEAAHRVTGVLDVANDLGVVFPNSGMHTDGEIADAVRYVLGWNGFVKHSERIHSTVEDGWVTLDGAVDTGFQRQEAVVTVLRLAGVKGVTNNIAVEQPPVDGDQIRRAISDALERQADREADKIEVGVRDGTLVLNGRVRSWREKRAVLGVASHARGIIAVEEHLVIDPYR